MTITVSTQLDTINCGSCGGIYAINQAFREKAHQEGTGWHCPYCEVSWGYFANNENAQLKKRVEQLERDNKLAQERRDAAEREAEYFRKSRDGMKGVLAKERKRVINGVCPCCKRTFQNLMSHMKSEHPEFK